MDKCSRVVCNNQSIRYIYVMKDECNQYNGLYIPNVKLIAPIKYNR